MKIEPKNKSDMYYNRYYLCDTDVTSVYSFCVDEIRPADVGLTPKMPFFSPPVTRQTPKITYLHIHECEKFSVCIAFIEMLF